MITFVTVVFSNEITLFELQALSIKKFVDFSIVDNFFIIINEDDLSFETYDSVQHIANQYLYEVRGKVKVFRASDFIRKKDERLAWRSQQYLKLKASLLSLSEHVLILDAKNHFMKNFKVEYFVDMSSGKMIGMFEGRGGLMEKYLLPSLDIFGVKDVGIDRTMSCVTPYITKPSIISGMISALESHTGIEFEDLFLNKNRMITEFFLLFAYLQKFNLINENYILHSNGCFVTLFTIWPDTEEKLNWAIQRAKQPEVICFGIHRERVPNIDERLRKEITDLWVANALFENHEIANNFINKLKSNYKPYF